MIKRMYISLILLLLLVTGSTGCGIVTGEEAAAAVIEACTSVDSYRFVEQSAATVNVTEGHFRGVQSVSQNSTASVDIANRRIETTVMQVGQPLYTMRSSICSYLLNERLYIRRDVLDNEDPDHEIWVRLHLDDEELNENDRLWNDRNPLGAAIDLLVTASSVILAGDETKAGEDLYLLDVTPEPGALTHWLLSQPPWSHWRTLDITEIPGFLSFRMRVSKKTFLIREIEVRLDDERVSSGNTTGITGFHGIQTFDAYNEPFDIILPEEARKAVRGPIS